MNIFDHYQDIALTNCQETALNKLQDFLEGPVNVFMLKGYAGSGKTTILKGLTKYLTTIGTNFSLMAPTGRAAKVIRERTGLAAFTIHKTIYSFDEMVEVQEGDSFYYCYSIRNSDDIVGKVFIVDEASMISAAKSESEFFRFGTSHLLSDLITYSRVTHPNTRTKIIFVGDPCQLPPVQDNSSKAFDATFLKNSFNLSCMETEMTEVKRHAGESGILSAATKLRRCISASMFNDFNLRSNGKDILNPTYERFLDTWREASSTKIIIAYKNKTCLDLNIQIREHRFSNSNLPVRKSDVVIMGGNNFNKDVFNGEFAVVNNAGESIEKRTVRLNGKEPVTLEWRDIELIFPDAESGNKIVKGKILENFLAGDNQLKPDEWQALYVDFKIRHPKLKPSTIEFKQSIIKDEYFNCLLIKYGYAVTCHKAQGGEWDNVFTIWDYGNEAVKSNANFYRWAYTAITRTSKTLYALEPPCFNSYSSMTFMDTPAIDAMHELTGEQNEVEEIFLDDDLQKQMSQFHLFEQPVQLQDHFIKVLHTSGKHNIELTGWQKLGYEIRYSFRRVYDNAVFKTYANGKNEFKSPFLPIPRVSQNEAFNRTLTELLNKLPNVSIQRNTPETILSKIIFEFEQEERFPCIRILFDDICHLFDTTEINIDTVEHLQYKERYTFRRKHETTVLDFEYNLKCFFGRVVSLKNLSNSPLLTAEIIAALKTLKKEENAKR